MISHPKYGENSGDWALYRDIMGPSSAFIQKYVYPVGKDDVDGVDFRRKVAYNPARVKYGAIRIKNSIFNRMEQITRKGGSSKYDKAVAGISDGVDGSGNSMNHFISTKIILELMVMGKVGIVIDNITGDFANGSTPYIYAIATEDITNWRYTRGRLENIVYNVRRSKIDENGLVCGVEHIQRMMAKHKDGVRVVDELGSTIIYDQILDISEIPFTIAELPYSIIDVVAKHQVAELNLASMDMLFGLKANTPFYTEQQSGKFNFKDNAVKEETVEVGVTKGRIYPKDMDRPGFIHASTDPLIASMAKQQAIAADVDTLLDLAVSNLTTARVSEGTRKTEFRGLEGGLSAIGKVLETAENDIARIWAMYETTSKAAHVEYPEAYELDSEETRLSNSGTTIDIFERLNSPLAQREAAKLVVDRVLRARVESGKVTAINAEIDKLNEVFVVPASTKEETTVVVDDE